MKVKRHMNTNYTRQNIKNATGEKQSTRKNKEGNYSVRYVTIFSLSLETNHQSSLKMWLKLLPLNLASSF